MSTTTLANGAASICLVGVAIIIVVGLVVLAIVEHKNQDGLL